MSYNALTKESSLDEWESCRQMRRLLVLACSQRKRSNSEPIQALDRYDGPAFRIVRRYLAVRDDQQLDLRILSAKYGLIRPEQPIHNYDLKMTAGKASEAIGIVLPETRRLLGSGCYGDVLFYGGRTYRAAVLPAIESGELPATSGSLGRQLSQLRTWLYEHSACPEHEETVTSPSHIRLRKHIIDITPDQAQRRASDLAMAQPQHAPAITTWYASVAGHRLPAKWLVSQLTGIPVGEFVTTDAVRMLTQLGIKTGRST